MTLSPRAAERDLNQQNIPCPSYETIRRWIIAGKVTAVRFNGRYWQVDLDSLIKYLKEIGYGQNPEPSESRSAH